MIQFTLTHLGKDGLRTLVFANQGRNFYSTREAAEIALGLFERDLTVKLGFQAIEVRAVECWDNGDAKGIYFDTPAESEVLHGQSQYEDAAKNQR